MSPLVQNILWCAAGIVGVLVVIKLFSKRPTKNDDTHVSDHNASNSSDNPKLIQKKVYEVPEPQSAKDAFLCNVDKFGSILPQLNDSLNIESWTEQIVDINNPQLTALWQRCLKNVAVWKQMLSSWGLRQDTCKSFTYLDKYANMYETADGCDPEVDCKYRVVDGCWILTDDSTGNKRVIKKGVIEKL